MVLLCATFFTLSFLTSCKQEDDTIEIVPARHWVDRTVAVVAPLSDVATRSRLERTAAWFIDNFHEAQRHDTLAVRLHIEWILPHSAQRWPDVATSWPSSVPSLTKTWRHLRPPVGIRRNLSFSLRQRAKRLSAAMLSPQAASTSTTSPFCARSPRPMSLSPASI